MKCIIFLLAVIILPVAGLAQTELLRSTGGSSVGVELLIPSFDTPPQVSYSGFMVIVSGKAAISDMISANVELPFVQSKTEYSGFSGVMSSSKGSLGNTYLGIGIGPANGALSGELGVRLNTFPKENGQAAFYGFFGDFPAIERYISESTIIRGGLNIHPRVFDEFSFLATLRPSVWIPAGGGESEWVSYYGLGAAYEGDVIKVGAGVNGLWLMRNHGGFFSNKQALHHFQAEANATFGMIRPGVMFRVPLDKELKITKFTLGFSVSVLF